MLINDRDKLIAALERRRIAMNKTLEQVRNTNVKGTSHSYLNFIRGRSRDVGLFATLLPSLRAMGLEVHVIAVPTKKDQRRQERLQQGVGGESEIGGGDIDE